MKMIKVVKIDTEGGSCPYQVEGWTDDGRPVYARYRHGTLRVEVGKPGEATTTWASDTVFCKKVTEENLGCMTYAELQEHTASRMEWVDYPEAQKPDMDIDLTAFEEWAKRHDKKGG